MTPPFLLQHVLVVPELESYTPRAQPGGDPFEMTLPPPRRRRQGGVQKPARRAAPQHATAMSRVPAPEVAAELTHLRWRGRKVSDELMRYAERAARGEELAPFTGPLLAEPLVETSRVERRRSELRTRAQGEPATSGSPGVRWLVIIAASVTCIAAALLPLDPSVFERVAPSALFLEGPEASPEAPQPPSDASPHPPSRSSGVAPTPATLLPAVSTTVPGKLTLRRARLGGPPRTRGQDAAPEVQHQRALFVEAPPF